MPPDVAARLVCGRVEAVARVRRQVDAADERDPVVDDDELLVVTVERTLPGVRGELDLRAEGQCMPDAVDVPAIGMEERQRRAGPHQHPHGDALGQSGEQAAELDAFRPAGEGEVRRDVPAREMDMRPGAPELGGEPRQRLGPIDEHLQRASLPRRWVAGRPEAAVRRLERPPPPEPAQPAPMVATDGPLGGVPNRLVDG